MPPYPVTCQTPDCGATAAYKVAAEWSDGVTAELKTYALTCRACLPKWLETAKDHHRVCRAVEGEMISVPKVFARGTSLTHRPELES